MVDIMKLFEDDDYISPGSIGGKIKRIRELRGLTQKQLGISCGFSSNTADVRIAQYEKNKKIPREKALGDITSALGVDECSLFDADLLPYNRMYHALFDLEDFHGLHPVKKEDGYYLEFSGRTILNQDMHRHDFDHFLAKWYEMYQKYKPVSTDTNEEREQKAAEYTLWRYEYPYNVAKETSKEISNRMKMNRLQAELDALHAEMESENELAKLDTVMRDNLADARNEYKAITKTSEFILLIKKMLEAGIKVERFSPEETSFDYDYIHVVSFKTEDILTSDYVREYYATFLCHIETMQKAGICIDKKITSLNKELYVTYEIPSSQYEYFENLTKCWDDMSYIIARKDSWPVSEIKALEKKFMDKITGNNDIIF